MSYDKEITSTVATLGPLSKPRNEITDVVVRTEIILMYVQILVIL